MARRFRLYLLLSVTEREHALQWNHCIRFVGQNMDKTIEIYNQIETRSTAETASILVHDERDLCAMRSLLQLMKFFDSIDEEVIPCLNRSCCRPFRRCSTLTIDRIRKVYDAVTSALETAQSESMPSDKLRIRKSQLKELQWAYCFILQQWLLVRIWVACFTHELLDETSQFPLMRASFAIAIAENVLEESPQLGQAALEVHGVNMIERIYDIAMGVIMAAQYQARVSGCKPSTTRIDSILKRYFELLDRLRNGESKFMSALQKAYESVQ
ncbi:hypothetical protein H2200_012029 [Cladophialophora chaetospira]|uniref:Uncharacterized protein n=1 Tax=Cladophialophora chaetospira TaxID=386627 RepID=A0AA38WY13_9EURO|nr:hypothetical protein H2200_012029 [Cladophialophora chaetospira]